MADKDIAKKRIGSIELLSVSADITRSNRSAERGREHAATINAGSCGDYHLLRFFSERICVRPAPTRKNLPKKGCERSIRVRNPSLAKRHSGDEGAGS